MINITGMGEKVWSETGSDPVLSHVGFWLPSYFRTNLSVEKEKKTSDFCGNISEHLNYSAFH